MLMSAFVFPGAGHFLLQRYRTAAALITIAATSTFIILKYVVLQAMLIADKIIAGEIAPNILMIRKLIKENVADTQAVNVAIWVLIAVWLISIIDTYRVGKQPNPAD